MKPILRQTVPIERLTGYDSKRYFFGYYDLAAVSQDGNYHLTHRIDSADRMQTATDRCEIGMIRLGDHGYIPLSTTYAWNFQQGTMLQWNPACPNEEIIYNVSANHGLCTVVQHVHTSEKRYLPRPVASVSPDGKWGLSINFARIFWFRGGYGYACAPDPFTDLCPADDGVFLMNMETGESELVLSAQTMRELAKEYLTEEEYHTHKYVVNHITFNTDGSRFVVLFRCKSTDPKRKGWKTLTFTANRDGSEPYLLLNIMGSHYSWRDPSHILFFANPFDCPTRGFYLFEDKTHNYIEYHPMQEGDGHCNYSPDRKFFLNDTYYRNGYRKLYLHDVEKDKSVELAVLRSENPLYLDDVDMRCDLHARFSPDGSFITFDSVHEGSRQIYRIDMEDIPLP